MRINLLKSKPALLVAAGLALAVGGIATVATATAPVAKTAPAKEGEFLFVQTSKGMTWDAGTGTLALTGVSPTTLFFTDRPNRVAGNMTTASFVPFWSKGKDSFSKDPPNADLSILENGKLQQVVVELKSPALKGDTLTYNATIIAGKMPAKGANVAVFIDIIGMPMTPVSVAGVARRSYARAVIR
ncbi:MAG TPA: hypothetical protein PK808_02085 [Polymorphobacter sp.]|nr:hypothetical protein [Polymorphobacter sp.]